MIKINKYNFRLIDKELDSEIASIDKLITEKLDELRTNSNFNDFFTELDKVIGVSNKKSFVKATTNTIKLLKDIDTKTTTIDLKDFSSLDGFNTFCKKKKKTNYVLNDLIEFLFGYQKESIKNVLKKFYLKLQLNNCVYCLASHTTTYINSLDNKIYIKGDLDHICPKSDNALLSVSLNNLIPICSSCNRRKLNATIATGFDYNPFVQSKTKSPNFNFTSCLSFSKGDISLENLNDIKIDNINDSLNIRLGVKDIYKQHTVLIANTLERYKKFNSRAYRKSIEEITGVGIGSNLEYFISELPYNEQNIQKVPLHKFKSDFYNELEEYKKNGAIKF